MTWVYCNSERRFHATLLASALNYAKQLAMAGLREIWSNVIWLFRVLWASAERFYVDNQFSRAAALAYTTLFSMVPVTALSFGFFASFSLTGDKASQVIDFFFSHYVPAQIGVDNVRDSIKELSAKFLSQFGEAAFAVNAVGIIFLVFTSILLLNSIEYALNEVWQVFESRNWSNRLVVFCAILVLAPIFAISVYYSARITPSQYLGDISGAGFLSKAYTQLLPFMIDFISFYLLYYLVPKAPVQLWSSLFGAFIAALLFSAAKLGFAIYIIKFSSYGAVYGALAAIPIFLFWLYLTWLILLLGAEASYQFQNLPKTGAGSKSSILDVGDGRVLLGVQALVLISRAFSAGEKLPNDWQMAAKLSCSSAVLKPVLNSLEKARIIARGDNNDMSVTLQKSPESLRVSEIVAAIKKNRMNVTFPSELAILFDSLDEKNPTADVTLAHILETAGK